jgi:thiamine biosynthesis protein ThiI
MLVKNIRWRIKPFGAFDFKKSQSTVIVTPRNDEADMDSAVDEISRVFGIAGYSRAAVTDKDMDKILEVAPIYLKDQLLEAKTFKVNAKRSDKKFPLKSPEISATLGGKLLECFPHLRVDVKNPDIIVTVEIRD